MSDCDKKYTELWGLLLLIVCDTAFWMEAALPVFLPVKADFSKSV